MTTKIGGLTYELVWATDVDYDGIRLEAWRADTIVMDVACGDDGRITVSTWEKDVPLKLVELCVSMARERLRAHGVAER